MCGEPGSGTTATGSPAEGLDALDDLIMEEGLPLDEVERRLRCAWRAGTLRHRVVAFYLADLDARGLQQLEGYASVSEWAARRFGMSRREARELLAAGRALRSLPGVDRAFADGRLCWSKVRELVRVATPEQEERWIETALRKTTDELALEVRLARPGGPPRDRNRKGLPEVRVRLDTGLPVDVYAKWERVRRMMEDESSPDPGGQGQRRLQEWECLEALCDLRLSMSEDGTVPGRRRRDASLYTVVVHVSAGAGPGKLDLENASVETEDGLVPLDPVAAETIACDARHINACGCPDCHGHAGRDPSELQRRAVLLRDGRRCACCGSRERLQIHHIVAVSAEGATTVDNLITLCRRCHALLHAGLLVIRGDARSGWTFEDRRGRNRHATDPPAPAELAIEPPRHARIMTVDDLPERISPDWFMANQHLWRFNDRTNRFEFIPGVPVGDPEYKDPRDAVRVEAADGEGEPPIRGP